MNFLNKICVVTGGANGIGLCIVNEFAKRGAKVAFIDLDKPAGKKALESIKAIGAEGLFYSGDIAEKEVLENFAGQVIDTYGRKLHRRQGRHFRLDPRPVRKSRR